MFTKQGYSHERRESGTVAEPKGKREKKEEGNPWTACCVRHVMGVAAGYLLPSRLFYLLDS